MPIQFNEFNIPFDKVLVRLGYARNKTKIDPKTEEVLHELMGTAKKLVVPSRVTAFSKIKFEKPGLLLLEPGFRVKSAKVFELLSGCETACGFAVTIGPHLERKRDLFITHKDVLRASILDAIGSVAAEELAEITHKENSAKAVSATIRFSPGYGDWDIAGQIDFLSWLGAGNIGITLTPKSAMIPEKSVSAVFGLRGK